MDGFTFTRILLLAFLAASGGLEVRARPEPTGTPVAPCAALTVEARAKASAVLEAALDPAVDDWESEAARRFALELRGLLRDRSRSGDDALAVLLGYGLGAAYDEDIECELKWRGRRVAPVLERLRTCAPCAIDRRFAPLMLPERLRRENVEAVLATMRRGERVECY